MERNCFSLAQVHSSIAVLNAHGCTDGQNVSVSAPLQANMFAFPLRGVVCLDTTLEASVQSSETITQDACFHWRAALVCRLEDEHNGLAHRRPQRSLFHQHVTHSSDAQARRVSPGLLTSAPSIERYGDCSASNTMGGLTKFPRYTSRLTRCPTSS